MNPSLPILVFTLLIRITLSVNPKFEACKPRTCGNGPNISYPFYIETQQDPFCGFPRFGLFCAPDGFPMLNISGSFYEVQEIFYGNHSLRVSDPTFSIPDPNTCLSPTKNLTLYGHRFNFAPNQTQLRLFFGCDSSERLQENRVGCSKENKTRSVLALPMDEEDYKLGYAKNNCGGGVMRTMVEDYGEKGIGDALRRGFVLKWKASDCEACENSGGRCGFDYTVYSFRCHCRDGDRLFSCPSENKSQVSRLGLGLGIGVPGLLLTVGVTLWRCKQKYNDSGVELGSRNGHVGPHTEGSNVYFGVPVFSYTELESATNNFDPTRELGDGGFGTVYYGKLEDGREVAVKRLYEQNYRRVEQFMNEVKILTRLRHKNLVSLYGCTSRHSRELLLVYEYVPNGTVAYHLHLHSNPMKATILPWPTRMKIAIQTASALAYLHASDIIHRDVKTNNILLDESFSVKVADFGLSRLFPNNVTHVSTAPQGTPGYLDPEYHKCYQLTSKSDVYSFGVVLMELISSMAAVDTSRSRDDINLSSLAVRKIQRSEVSELVDPSLGFESDGQVKRMVVAVAQLAFQCLQSDKELRPSMDEVLEVLVKIQSGGDQVREDSPLPPPSPNWDQVGLLNNMKVPPRSPTSVADKWASRSTTPNVSGE